MEKVSRSTHVSFDGGREAAIALVEPVNRVRLEKAAPLYLSRKSGPGLLIGFGTHFDFVVDEWEGEHLWSPVAGVIIRRTKQPVHPTGEAFTNFDKRPGPSDLEMLVKRELRLYSMREAAKREERAKADREAVAAGIVKPSEGKEPPAEPVETEPGDTVETPTG